MDFDFPPFLDTSEKQIKRAERLAYHHLGVEAVSAHHVALQGMFSKTIKVTLKDNRDIIIQFRIEPLDTEPFNRARKVLGDLVPIIEPLDDPELVAAEIWPFYMNCISGKPWGDYEDEWSDAQRIKASGSLGQLCGQCFCEGNASEIVDKVIIPNLQRLRALEREDVKPLQSFIERMIEEAPRLKILPVFLGHYDLNDMNILADREGRVTGVVDWELSTAPQPFGIGLYGIHFLAGEIIDGNFRKRPIFEEMERTFWKALLKAAPGQQQIIMDNLGAVQTSVLIGILFRVMTIESDSVIISEALLRALPQLMNYQIPAIRGSRAAYGNFHAGIC
jgi:hypothetical protein